MGKAADRRPTMHGGRTVDLDMCHELQAPLAEEKRRDLLMVQAGGLWTAHSLEKAGYLTTARCPWCLGDVEDLEHLWWQCPAFEHLREAAKKGYWREVHRRTSYCV